MLINDQRSMIERWLALAKAREVLVTELLRVEGTLYVDVMRNAGISMIDATMSSLLRALGEGAGPVFMVLKLHVTDGVVTVVDKVACTSYQEHEAFYSKWCAEIPVSTDYNNVTTMRIG